MLFRSLLNIFPVLSSAECARAFEMFGDLTDASHLWSDMMEGGLYQYYVDVIDSSINRVHKVKENALWELKWADNW